MYVYVHMLMYIYVCMTLNLAMTQLWHWRHNQQLSLPTNKEPLFYFVSCWLRDALQARGKSNQKWNAKAASSRIKNVMEVTKQEQKQRKYQKFYSRVLIQGDVVAQVPTVRNDSIVQWVWECKGGAALTSRVSLLAWICPVSWLPWELSQPLLSSAAHRGRPPWGKAVLSLYSLSWCSELPLRGSS